MSGKCIYQRPEHAHSSITGGTTAKTDDDLSRSFPDSISHQLTCAIACGYHGVSFLFGQQGESTGFRYFNHGHLVVQQVLSCDRPHQRIPHSNLLQLSTNGSMEGLHIAFPAIAYGYLHNLSLRKNAPDAFCSCPVSLLRGQTTLE